MPAGKIGPNAIVQTVAAITERHGAAEAREVLAASAGGFTAEAMPATMVPEGTFRSLVQATILRFGEAEAIELLQRSGRLTAGYVLANRIPAFAQRLIRAARKSFGAAILLRAIAANAGTFGESGRFTFATRPKLRIRITNPYLSGEGAASAICAYNRGAFSGLFEALIDERIGLIDETCQARGDAACTYRMERGIANVI